MTAAAFRAQFPVLERIAYLNAGTTGPLPGRAVDALAEHARRELTDGRSGAGYIERLHAGASALRGRYAGLLGCDPDEVALTRSATDGINAVLAALDLRAGDEVLTSDEEHPGVLAPLELARRRHGIVVRHAPFARIVEGVTERTRLVACSHVSWVGGRVVDSAALAATGVPVLLDGAQGLGAVALDVRALGCDFYAAAGQKWCCGPEGTGCLYVRGDRAEELLPAWPSYVSLADPARAGELPPKPGATRFDMGVPPQHLHAAVAALDVLAEPGPGWVQQQGVARAGALVGLLAERGAQVAPRGDSTLVSWSDADPALRVERLAAAGVVVRAIPGRDLVRASVGAWSSDGDLERLLAGLD